jgi:serine/threonine-protein kinase
VVGTAQYISPEQAQGQAVDYRSDLYSLGCCLYEMLTGTVPFTGATPVAIAYRHVREDPTPPATLNRDVPAALEAVCLKAMAKRPEDRYQTAVELRQDLDRARAGQRVAAGAATTAPATAAMATAVLPPLAGYPGAGDVPTSMLGGPVTPGRAARYAEPAPRRRRWLTYLLVPLAVLALAAGAAFLVSRVVGTLPPTEPALTLPTATTPPSVETTALPTTSEPPSTSPSTTATPTTAAPTTNPQPAQVEVPNVLGRRPRVARARLEQAGLQVDQREIPVPDPRQVNRVVLQSPGPGSIVERGATVTIVIGVRIGG